MINRYIVLTLRMRALSSIATVIGLLFIFSGILGILISIIYESTIVVFIGLTLILWGFLFVLVLPGKYLSTEVVDSLLISNFLALDQIIAYSNFKGNAIYIPISKESYLPDALGFKNEFIYISKNDETDEITIQQAFETKQKGLRFTPPGLSLVNMMEKIEKLDFSKLDFDNINEVLPSIITDKLEISNKFEIFFDKNEVRTKITQPTSNICTEVSKMKYICPYIGCPLISSISCILTRSYKKPVRISECLLIDEILESRYIILT